MRRSLSWRARHLPSRSITGDRWTSNGVRTDSDGQLYILQARPETVKSRLGTARVQRYRIRERGAVIIEGRAIGQKIGAGAARVLSDRRYAPVPTG